MRGGSDPYFFRQSAAEACRAPGLGCMSVPRRPRQHCLMWEPQALSEQHERPRCLQSPQPRLLFLGLERARNSTGFMASKLANSSAHGPGQPPCGTGECDPSKVILCGGTTKYLVPPHVNQSTSADRLDINVSSIPSGIAARLRIQCVDDAVEQCCSVFALPRPNNLVLFTHLFHISHQSTWSV